MTKIGPSLPHFEEEEQEELVGVPRVDEMDTQLTVTEENPALWDWGDLLDFTADDQFTFTLPFVSDHESPVITPAPVTPLPTEDQDPTESGSSGRIRKRDPRLLCENFVAGRVPCACPELDAMMEEAEEQEGGHGKKRVRTARAPPRTARALPGTARCQVPGCEADIRELKGYHRRHRVCLRCANSSAVLLEGQSKRYCQQCGKFHILSDFDEGKRSCRRKLERHNNRRRRKPNDHKGSLEKESHEDLMADDVSCDVEPGKDSVCLSNPIAEKDGSLGTEDGLVSIQCSGPGSQNVQGDSVLSFGASDETQINGGKDNSKYGLSSLSSENKSAYSSTCPTGRISFKLYDWNPAEFPRRLRLQIFQWLSSMPVELEGYIRPGCTILTAFIAMPKIMWMKLHENPSSYLHDFVVEPGRLLSGKGTVLVYLNDMIFRVVRDGASLVKVKMDAKAPRIHYVHPTCFEAGKPMEFVVCGSNLIQPKFRFLVSFAGKYLGISLPHGISKGDPSASFEHQLYKITVPLTEPNLFGPAFVEVENESGLSNFIPILIGDKEVCSEMKILLQRLKESLSLKGLQFAANSCEVSILRQTAVSELILDIAWLLKEPASESIQNHLTSSQIQRYNCLINILISNDSTIILKKVLQPLRILMDRVDSPISSPSDDDIRLFQKNLDKARDYFSEKLRKRGTSVLQSLSVPEGVQHSQSCSKDDMLSIVRIANQDIETSLDGKFRVMPKLPSRSGLENVSLLSRGDMIVGHIKEWPKKSSSGIFSTTNLVLGSRRAVIVIAVAVVCFGACAVLLHPHKVGKFAVTIRRCLFDKF